MVVILYHPSGRVFKYCGLEPLNSKKIEVEENDDYNYKITSDSGVFIINKKYLTEIELVESVDGYLFVEGSGCEFTRRDGSKSTGTPVHRMVVFSFNDCNGRFYEKAAVIDHINQNKKDNSVRNLEIVSDAVNLARAVRKSNYGRVQQERFEEYINSLSPAAARIAWIEIELDMRGCKC